MRIVTSTSHGVHQQVPSIARVGSSAIDPRTGGYSLKWRTGCALVVAISERVRGRCRQKAGQVYDHAVEAHVVVGRHQRWALWAVDGLVERPGALTRALGLRVANPDVCELGILAPDAFDLGTRCRSMGATPARAKTINRYVGSRKYNVDGVSLITL
ncbi:hypothetical protein RJ639_008904 [Escallonia herrerae]|uniref:Uncharacterized protein n=1 Tax=Escallonia herrerae TaxID=1293975 RepID=A0AA88VV26_9ASTE|nr:hypothetical protein RJ639_008904 [Escallonia herrerae]